ncbi:polyamine ABC transporter substrate-binding protein [Brevibacillus fluminis]|uniref:polyamine ABC transporter substrate-binding protein n=1 Tax=Brevibacillus fluminis TaxID=511487 RepID=UPI003F8C5184
MKKNLKKWTSLAATMLLGASLIAGCSSGSTPNETASDAGTGAAAGSKDDGLSKELNLFIWSEYIPQSVLDQFQQKYGVKINYATYASNEEMFAKLAVDSSSYDLSVASGYMVEAMKKQNLLAEIDHANIPNLKNVGKEFLTTPSDPESKFSVPYLWGNVVIAVNTDKVKIPIKGYKDLFNPELKQQLVVLDDARSMIGLANIMQGKSINETDSAVLQKSKQLLIDLKPNVKAFDSDSPKTLLLNGEATAGIVYGAEASLARRENPAIKTILPEEGFELWQDDFVIPKNSPHKKTAEAFINFILQPEISAEISKEFPYANPNMEAHKLMDKAILEDPAVYPPQEDMKRGQYMVDLGEKSQELDRIWSELKLQ